MCSLPTNRTLESWATPLDRYDLPPMTDFPYGTEEVCRLSISLRAYSNFPPGGALSQKQIHYPRGNQTSSGIQQTRVFVPDTEPVPANASVSPHPRQWTRLNIYRPPPKDLTSPGERYCSACVMIFWEASIGMPCLQSKKRETSASFPRETQGRGGPADVP